jgi:hypothetical protein
VVYKAPSNNLEEEEEEEEEEDEAVTDYSPLAPVVK